MLSRTKDPKYLEFVQHLADAYLKRLPVDYMPYWNFDDPSIPNGPRDTSSAVVASGLLNFQRIWIVLRAKASAKTPIP